MPVRPAPADVPPPHACREGCGACSIAPAVVYDGAAKGKQGPDDVIARLEEW